MDGYADDPAAVVEAEIHRAFPRVKMKTKFAERAVAS